MKLFALDTSSPNMAMAMFSDDLCLAVRNQKGSFQHAKHIFSLFDQLVLETKIFPDKLDCIACGVGPGSFTGLRVGISFIKGLVGLQKSLPILPLSSVELVAQNRQEGDKRIAVLLDARSDQFYCQIFVEKDNKTVPETELIMLSKEQVLEKLKQEENLCYLGDAFVRHYESFADCVSRSCKIYPEALWYPAAENFEKLVPLKKPFQTISAMELAPNYLRLSEPEERQLRES